MCSSHSCCCCCWPLVAVFAHGAQQQQAACSRRCCGKIRVWPRHSAGGRGEAGSTCARRRRVQHEALAVGLSDATAAPTARTLVAAWERRLLSDEDQLPPLIQKLTSTGIVTCRGGAGQARVPRRLLPTSKNAKGLEDRADNSHHSSHSTPPSPVHSRHHLFWDVVDSAEANVAPARQRTLSPPCRQQAAGGRRQEASTCKPPSVGGLLQAAGGLAWQQQVQ